MGNDQLLKAALLIVTHVGRMSAPCKYVCFMINHILQFKIDIDKFWQFCSNLGLLMIELSHHDPF